MQTKQTERRSRPSQTTPPRRESSREERGTRRGNQAIQRLVRLRNPNPAESVHPRPGSRPAGIQRLCTDCQRRIRAGKPPDCPDCERRLRRSDIGTGGESAAVAETGALPVDARSLSAGGRPLPESTRSRFESQFGHDFGRVRIHDGARAAGLNRRLNAEAFTLGSDIHFGAGNYRPATDVGRRLLAHELSHVVQQRGTSRNPARTPIEVGPPDDRFEREAERVAESIPDADPPAPSPHDAERTEETTPARGRTLASTLSRDTDSSAKLRRFTRGERGEISSVDAVVGTARRLADETSLGLMRWGRFTAAAGGSGALEALASPESGSTRRLANRYLFTCRCGLIDMRHFYQLMYIGVVASNETATKKGREHELQAEPESRFAPEDTASNALGAYFGSQQSWFQRPGTFVSNLESYLQRCDPVDFATMPKRDRDAVVDFYAARAATGEPATPRETAVPDILGITACGTDRAFPFTLAPSDPNQKTIRGRR